MNVYRSITRNFAGIVLFGSLLAMTAFGCRSRPLMTVMNGNMQVKGKMDMAGNMDMRGDMRMAGEVSTVMKADNTASRLASVTVTSSSNSTSGGRVCIIDVDGLMVNKNMSGFGSMGENPAALFREKLDAVVSDPSIQALVIRINSCGGGVTATDMMSRDLERFVAHREIPVVACIMDVGAGGGYFLACGCNRIVAHPTSLVGGIGVILNSYNLEDMMGQFGIVPIPIKQGPMIDMGTPGRAMEELERRALQNIADQFHGRFVTRVKTSRSGLDLTSELFDGRVFSGEDAFHVGLVDQLGYMDDAIDQACQLANIQSTPEIIMLRRDRDRAYTALDVTPNSPSVHSIIPIRVPGLDRSTLPTFLYLWQPEPIAF